VREVAIDLGPERGDAVAQALVAAGFATGGKAPWARVTEAREATLEEVEAVTAWVLRGGVLAICGGTGPLLAALHLTPGDEGVEGPVEAAAPGAPSLPLEGAWPVTGVGYALYRVGERCVALAGRRGAGWVAYVGAPEPALITACLRWLAARCTP
jgi:hypothetical protein